MLYLLENANVFAPRPLGIVNLLIGGDRILWLGDAAAAAALRLPGLVRIDLEGRRLIPGFIDGHAHVTGGGGESGYASRVPPVPLSHFSRAGITSVVGVLGTDDLSRNTQSLLAQVRGLRAEGLSAWCHTGGYHLPPVTLTGSVRSDIVNLDPVIGVGEVAISDHRSSQPTQDELNRLASEAHVAGLMSGKAGIVHLHLGDGERGLEMVRRALLETELPPRVFNPTHVNRQEALFDEAKSLVASGVTIDLTAFPVLDGEDGLPAEAALLDYLDAGLPPERITISSDGGGCLPQFDVQGELTRMEIGSPSSLLACLVALLDEGLPLERALPAFTCNVARLLRLHHKGEIAVGKHADLLVLDDDFSLRDVMIRGLWHRRAHQQLKLGQFESPASISCP